MRATWEGLTLEAIDHELVWAGAGSAAATREPLGSFSDAHFVQEPARRLVSGYLMVEAAPGAEGFTISSHGHPVGVISTDVDSASGTVITVGLAGDIELEEGVVRSSAGIALVADAGTQLRAVAAADPAGRPGAIVARGASGTGCGLTLVHGPAAVKVENRMRLLASLERVGGRHG